jgi:hypothetical protein
VAKTYQPRRHLPVEAVQWTTRNWAEVSQFAYGEFVDERAMAENDPIAWDNLPVATDGDCISLVNSEGNPYVEPYGYIYRHPISDEIMGMDEAEFEAAYEV